MPIEVCEREKSNYLLNLNFYDKKKTSLRAFFRFILLMEWISLYFFFENHHHQLNKFIRIKMKALDDGENVFSN